MANNRISQIENEILSIVPEERIVVTPSMSRFTSFRVGGSADFLVYADNTDELTKLLKFLSGEKIPHFVIGNGSNILVKDGGYKGIVIKLSEKFNTVEVSKDLIEAGAGAKLSAVCKKAMENSLEGMEFACGIPGSIGGAIFMNAGAYGGELKDIVKSVTAMKKDGSEIYTVEKERLNLGYRHSIFTENGDVILKGTFKLTKGVKEEINAKMSELMEQRNGKQPVCLASAGSFFKRPEGYFAGKLIQDSGLKGLSVGNAQVSPLHSGFIVNNGGATAAEVLSLMKLVQETVYDKFGVRLDPEVKIIGED